MVEAQPLSKDTWRVTVVGYDYLGELSIICGLFFVFGFNIVDGNAFTYEPLPDTPASSRPKFNRFDDSTRRLPPRRKASSTSEPDTRRKIVDVFTVEANPFIHHDASVWDTYTNDLHHLLRMMRAGQRREARGELAVRVGQAYKNISSKLILPAADQHRNR